MSRGAIGWAALLLVGCFASPAQAQINLKWAGRIQSDIRGRINHKQVGDWTNGLELDPGIAFNRNLYKFQLTADAGRAQAVVNIDFLWLGITDKIHRLSDLTLREDIDPYRLKAHAIYVDVYDVFVNGLDLRIGQQVVNWGKGDQFNPTNTICANDFEDPLLFGEQLANSMLRADYAFAETWTLSAVVVPVFKPALLPPDAGMQVADVQRVPIVQDSLRRHLLADQAVARLNGYTTVVSDVRPVLPKTAFDNMQYALRLASDFFGQDVALSYYIGRTDIPQPFANHTSQVNDARCNPNNPSECIKGALSTVAELRYPRVQVIGLNLAGEVNPFGWISKSLHAWGYHLELGFFIPEAQQMRLYQDTPVDIGIGGLQPAGEYNYGLGAGRYPTSVDATPFAKWNLGVDHTFGEHFYLNIQWVHGFTDEFGAGDFFSPSYVSLRGTAASPDLVFCDLDPEHPCVSQLEHRRLGDYLVLGVDSKFLDNELLIRLFVIYDLSGVYNEHWDANTQQRVRTYYNAFTNIGSSSVVYPEITYNVGGGLELSVGALLMFGRPYTKFGSAATGGSLIWTRARFNY